MTENDADRAGPPGMDGNWGSSEGAAGPATDEAIFGVLEPEAAAALQSMRQGDVLEGLKELTVRGPDGKQARVGAPNGVVLISQTCDIVQPNRLSVQVAPRVQLPETVASEARDGRRPRFVHLPAIGDSDFADLEVVATVAKACVAELSARPGVIGGTAIKRFAAGVARKYGRFPFPDEVSPWLRPLEDVVSSKYKNENSPEGRALQQVVELRVESARGWLEAPYELTLCVIVEPGVLPTFVDDLVPEVPVELAAWLYAGGDSLQRASGQIAERLSKSTDPVERHWLWMALGDAWADRCKPRGGTAQEVRDAVSQIVAEVVPADEFPLTRVRRSEILDLDHLSEPTPG